MERGGHPLSFLYVIQLIIYKSCLIINTLYNNAGFEVFS